LTQYYVATTGNDSTGTGAIGNPWLTIAKAATVVVAGDTVNVLPGMYILTSQLTLTTSGTSGSPITYQSTVLWGAHLLGSNIAIGVSIEGDYNIFSGFDFTADNTCYYGILARKTFATVQRCRVHDYNPVCSSGGGCGVGSNVFGGTYSGSHNDFISNLIFNIGPTGSGCNFIHGVYSTLPFDRILNNIVINCSARGINTYHAATNTQIINNFVAANRAAAGIIIAAETALGVNNNSVVANNICINNTGYGINEGESTGVNNLYLNNCTFGNTIGGYLLNNGLTPTGSVTTDPLIANYQIDGSGNYRPTKASPCIGAGTATDMPATDFDGNTRSSSFPTIGPYIFQSAFSSLMAHV
jgi:hypothetical protein